MLDRPTMIKMLDERMEQLYQNGNADVQRLKKEIERMPDDAELWFELGLAHNQAGLQYIDMAFEKAALEYYEANPEAEGEPEHLTVEVPKAMEMFTSALQVFDKVLIAFGNMHRYEEAEQCYLKALEEDEEDFTAASYLSMVYRDMGKDDLADKYQKLSEELNDSADRN